MFAFCLFVILVAWILLSLPHSREKEMYSGASFFISILIIVSSIQRVCPGCRWWAGVCGSVVGHGEVGVGQNIILLAFHLLGALFSTLDTQQKVPIKMITVSIYLLLLLLPLSISIFCNLFPQKVNSVCFNWKHCESNLLTSGFI